MNSLYFMKLATTLRFVLFLFGSSLANLHAELPSLCKAKDDNATKALKKEKKEEEKEEPKTVEAQKKYVRIELALKGYFEDPDAVSISIPTKNWVDLKVTEPPVQGRRIKKGDLLLRFDLEKIKQRLDLLASDLSVIDLDRQILSSELQLAETLAPIEKKELDRIEKYVRQDFERFNKSIYPTRKSRSHGTEVIPRQLAYATEELNQLKRCTRPMT